MIIHPAVNHGEIREHALRSKPIVKFNALALLQLVDAQGPVALDYLLDGDVQSYFKAIKNAKPRFVLRRFLSNSFRGPRYCGPDQFAFFFGESAHQAMWICASSLLPRGS